MAGNGAVEALLRRDRAILLCALAALTTLAAAYTVLGVGMGMSAAEMTAGGITAGGMTGGGMMTPAAWTPAYAVLVFLMWWVMMIAMMTPSAAPMILLHAAVKRKTEPAADAAVLSAVFLGGYLAVWALFGAGATALQWALELRGLVSPAMMALTSTALGGLILLAAGLYQFTPVKHACLAHCRSPAHFLSRHHRPGAAGAFRLGVIHGAYCLGCCWFLMALLFVGGVMNLYWIAGLALFVMAEKLLPRGELVARVAGAALAAGGAAMLGAVILDTAAGLG